MWGFAATCCLMVGGALFKADAGQSRVKAYTLNSQEPEVKMNLKDSYFNSTMNKHYKSSHLRLYALL